MRQLIAAAAFVLIGAGRVLAQAPSIEPVRTATLAHPDDASKHIEIYWTKPAGEGPWPVLILVHGHQEPERPGAKTYVDSGSFERYASRGLLVAAVSQPGYGKSDGPPDFCGPRSQRAVIAAIDHFRRQPFVDAKRIALYGYSRGAVVASMVSSQVPDLAAVVLGGGIYDLKATYKRMFRGIQRNIDQEAGKSDEAYRARSAIFHVNRIKSPTLVLHGEQDDRASAESAKAFGAALEKTGTPVRVVIFPGVGHGIPPAQQTGEWAPFLRQYLGIK
jgi:dipeptidyl aminopeptidase/acylaminoacyl peptidase